MLGFSEPLKPLRQELKSIGADGPVLRDWLKTYEKVNNNYAKVEKLYTFEREKLVQLQQILIALEKCFTNGTDAKTMVSPLMVQLKNLKNLTGHEFLIDKGNTEFELTFSRMQKQSNSIQNYTSQDMLFLQSEVENLIDMVKEALEKEIPDLHALAYFELTQKASTLSDLPHLEKVRKIRRIYECEFIKPMAEMMSVAMDKADISMPILSANKDKSKEDRINYILEEWIWK